MHKLIKHRNTRSHAENKSGPIKRIQANDKITQMSFIYNSKTNYLGLNRKLTLITAPHIFKKWSKHILLKTKKVEQIRKYSDNNKQDIVYTYPNNTCTQ